MLRHTQPVSPSVGLQGVGQVLLKLLVKLPSPALAWIPERCGADHAVLKLRAAVETPPLSVPTCSLSPPQPETYRKGIAMCDPAQAAGLPLPGVKSHNQHRVRMEGRSLLGVLIYTTGTWLLEGSWVAMTQDASGVISGACISYTVSTDSPETGAKSRWLCIDSFPLGTTFSHRKDKG